MSDVRFSPQAIADLKEPNKGSTDNGRTNP